MTKLVTIEYQPKRHGPRSINRFEWRKDGDYTGVLPKGSKVFNVWGNSGKGGQDDDVCQP